MDVAGALLVTGVLVPRTVGAVLLILASGRGLDGPICFAAAGAGLVAAGVLVIIN